MTDISKQKFLINNSSGGGTTNEDNTFTVACCAFKPRSQNVAQTVRYSMETAFPLSPFQYYK